MSQTPASLDFHIDVVTPENVSFHYRAAGPFRRLPAFLIDLVIRIIILVAGGFVLTWCFGLIGLPGIGLFFTYVLSFLVIFFYGGVFETYWNGQTPGKRLTSLRVLTTSGEPIDAMQAILRNLIQWVDLFPLCPVLGLAATAMNVRYQRLGDLVCGTMVVVEQRDWLRGLTPVDAPAAVRLAAYIPPTFEISRSMGQALAAYVGRRKRFGEGRRADIARHLGQPLVTRLELPPDTSHDLLLCALYYRTFIADARGDDQPPAQPLPVVTPTADTFHVTT